MNLSLVAKLAMAGVVLTGVTGTAIVGNIAGVNQEAKAEQDNPNAKYYEVEVGGQKINLKDTFNKEKLNAKILSDDLAQKLSDAGLNPADYKFRFTVKDSSGGTINGGGTIGGTLDNQSAEFNPTKNALEDFQIYK